MKRNFTLTCPFKLTTRLFLNLGFSLFFISALQAANFEVDSIQSLASNLTANEILYIKLRPTTISHDSIDAGFALGTDSIKAWADYSCYVRFSNFNKPAYIDARNGSGMALSEGDTIPYSLGQEYHVWIQVDLTANTYNVYVQAPDATDPVKIAADFAFRKTPVTDLKFFACLHNGDETTSFVDVLDLKLTDTIGIADTVPTTGIQTQNQNSFEFGNYPNPFSDYTTISYRLIESSSVSLKIYDLNGREVSTLVNEMQRTGRYDYVYEKTNLTTGNYYCKLTINNNSVTRKLIIN